MLEFLCIAVGELKTRTTLSILYVCQCWAKVMIPILGASAVSL